MQSRTAKIITTAIQQSKTVHDGFVNRTDIIRECVMSGLSAQTAGKSINTIAENLGIVVDDRPQQSRIGFSRQAYTIQVVQKREQIAKQEIRKLRKQYPGITPFDQARHLMRVWDQLELPDGSKGFDTAQRFIANFR